MLHIRTVDEGETLGLDAFCHLWYSNAILTWILPVRVVDEDETYGLDALCQLWYSNTVLLLGELDGTRIKMGT